MGNLESWRDEMQSAHLYRAMAESEAGSPRAQLFLSLAREATDQAAIWATRVSEDGGSVPARYTPQARVKLVTWLVGQLGPKRLSSVLVAMKVRGLSVYQGPLTLPQEDGAAAADGAARGQQASSTPERGLFPIRGLSAHGDEAEGRRHRAVRSGGNLRAAVFGVSDGLVSNAGLILGVAGATGDADMILLSGIAGLLAGAFSMAAGEYISVRSQRELFEYQIRLERDELALYPEEEASELALIYEARGISKAQARAVADRIIADPDRALDTLAREELGLDPDTLGSPFGAAGSSFVAFAAGAAVPVAPFAFLPLHGLSLSLLCSGVSLFAVGAVLSLFTGLSAIAGGLRMLAIAAAAGSVTYGIGWLLSSALR